MPVANFLWAVLGVLAGAAIAIQAPINTALGRGLGLPSAAAGFSFFSGAVLLALVSLGFIWWQGESIDLRAPAGWTFVAGGVLGAFYVTVAILLVPKVGAAAVMAFAVTGQLLAGMLIDRIGFMGVAVREISLGRITGAVLLLCGALLIRLT
jgi:bacterial/archaeal transporter family-2 protein